MWSLPLNFSTALEMASTSLNGISKDLPISRIAPFIAKVLNVIISAKSIPFIFAKKSITSCLRDGGKSISILYTVPFGIL